MQIFKPVFISVFNSDKWRNLFFEKLYHICTGTAMSISGEQGMVDGVIENLFHEVVVIKIKHNCVRINLFSFFKSKTTQEQDILYRITKKTAFVNPVSPERLYFYTSAF